MIDETPRDELKRDLCQFLGCTLVTSEGLAADPSSRDELELITARKTFPVGLDCIWGAFDLAVNSGITDDELIADYIRTIVMNAFVVGSRGTISENTRKHAQKLLRKNQRLKKAEKNQKVLQEVNKTIVEACQSVRSDRRATSIKNLAISLLPQVRRTLRKRRLGEISDTTLARRLLQLIESKELSSDALIERTARKSTS